MQEVFRNGRVIGSIFVRTSTYTHTVLRKLEQDST